MLVYHVMTSRLTRVQPRVEFTWFIHLTWPKVLGRSIAICRLKEEVGWSFKSGKPNIRLNEIWIKSTNLLHNFDHFFSFRDDVEPKENFMRNWEDYKVGFGDFDREFWLGNWKYFLMIITFLENFFKNMRNEC